MSSAAFRAPQRFDAASAAHRQWLRRIKCFVFDIDGVIHTTAGAVPGAASALSALRQAGVGVRFLTNNAGKF